MTGRVKKAAAPKKKANGYKMPAPITLGEVINDNIAKKKWRIGPSIGIGGFGEIYSACEHENSPKKGSSYPFVVKIVSKPKQSCFRTTLVPNLPKIGPLNIFGLHIR